MWAAIAGAAASLGGSIWGGIQASKQAKKAEDVLAQQRQKNDDWYGRRYYQDYVQTAEAQNLLNRAREEAQRQVQSAVGRSRVGGGSAEEVAAAMEKAGDMQASVAGNIAAQATQDKRAVDSAYRQQDAALSNQYYNLYNTRAQNSSQAASAAMKAGMDLATADMQAHLKYGRGLFGELSKKKSQNIGG